MKVVFRYPFKFFPVIVGVANDHGLEFIGLEELQDLPSTHFVEPCMEGLKKRGYGAVEHVVHICLDKILPVNSRGSKQSAVNESLAK